MVAEIKNKITQSISWIDESFNNERGMDYELTLIVSTDSISIGVKDITKKKHIAVEQYLFQNVYNFDIIHSLIKEVFSSGKLTNQKYAKVNCVISNNLATIIPAPLFDEEKKKLYLKLNTELQGDELILENELKTIQAKNIFALPIGIKTAVDFNFQNTNYIHVSTILIERLIAFNKNQNSKKAFLHIELSHFEIIIIEGNNLLYYNTFNHHSPEDLIYYVLFVFEQLELNPEKIDLNLLGTIEKNSPYYSILLKYIRNIKFIEYRNNDDYSYQLQALPKHQHFILFNT